MYHKRCNFKRGTEIKNKAVQLFPYLKLRLAGIIAFEAVDIFNNRIIPSMNSKIYHCDSSVASKKAFVSPSHSSDCLFHC
jgi:hypothetical protein